MRGLYYFPFLSLFYYLGNVECFSTYTNNNNNVVRKTTNPSSIITSYVLPRSNRMMQRGLISTTKTTSSITPNTLKIRTRLFAENFEQQQQQQEQQQIVGDPLVSSSAFALRRSSWFSWWVQMILTIISTVILVFARTILVSSSSPSPPQGNSFIARKYLFFPSGLGVLFSYLSILWTWGETRLSSRIVNRQAQQQQNNNKNKENNNTSFISQIGAASITRRAITIGITINCIGLFFTFLGAFQTVGILSAKALANVNFSSLNASGINVVSQTLQPLDLLIIQANTNTLFSHFASLVLKLFWGKRWILQLDPPSIEDDEY